jgi:ABC-type transport system involved in multi-copper enzyme maturation permease subunit
LRESGEEKDAAMRMIVTLIKREILEDIYNIRFVILALLCCVLIPMTLFINQKTLSRDMEDYYQALAKYEERLTSGQANTLTFEASGFRPPSPLRMFSNGLDSSLPSEIQTTREEGIKSASTREDDSTHHALFGNLDLLFIVKVVMSLIAIIFTFNAISGEKEQGTLKLILSNSIPRYKVAVAKYLGNFLILAIPFSLGLVIGLLIIVFTSGTQILSEENLPRIFLMFVVALIYISLFLNLGLFVSVVAKRSWTSIVFLLFAWVVFVLVVPQTSGMLADIVYPIKSRRVLNIEKDIQRKNIETEQSMELRDIFRKDNYDQLRAPIVDKYRQLLGKRLENIELEYTTKKQMQRTIATSLSRVSPASSLTFVFSELSNTGYLEQENFTARAREFQDLIDKNVYAGTYSESAGSGLSVKLGSQDLSNVPRFATQEIQFERSLAAVEPDMFLLLTLNILFFAAGVLLFTQYDIR